MRMYIAKAGTDLQQLTQSLVKGAANTDPAASIDRLKVLNPHVDFGRIEPGTVLLVPDAPEFEGGDARSIGGDAYASLAQDAGAGLRTATSRVRSGFERMDAQRKEVSGVLKSAQLKRLQEADPALREEAAGADARLKADQKQAADALSLLDAADKALAHELAALGRLFG